MADYKRINKEAYDAAGETYAQKVRDYWTAYPDGRRTLARFLALLPGPPLASLARLGGPRVLDLGSGGGRDSSIFQNAGNSPVCFDSSLTMARISARRGLTTVQGDIESLPFAPESFAGVWAYKSLQHVPRAHIPAVLKELSRITIPGSPVLISLFEGDGDQWIESERLPGTKRFFALWRKNELRRLVRAAGFAVLKTKKLSEPDLFEILAVKPNKKENIKGKGA